MNYFTAKQIYSNVLGYLSGTSLSIMAAKICLLYPTGDLEFLLGKFFHIFGMWYIKLFLFLLY
jgi:poly(A) polymerase Pap1